MKFTRSKLNTIPVRFRGGFDPHYEAVIDDLVWSHLNHPITTKSYPDPESDDRKRWERFDDTYGFETDTFKFRRNAGWMSKEDGVYWIDSYDSNQKIDPKEKCPPWVKSTMSEIIDEFSKDRRRFWRTPIGSKFGMFQNPHDGPNFLIDSKGNIVHTMCDFGENSPTERHEWYDPKTLLWRSSEFPYLIQEMNNSVRPL